MATAGVALDGNVCVVTGANTGIGFETTRALAVLGAQVAMVVRDRGKGEAAADKIHARYPEAKLDVHVADLASFRQVRMLAGELHARYPRLDVLVNNAGLWMDRRTLTEDGIEAMMQVNYFAPFLLTNLLLDRLTASAPARIVNVSSTAHYAGRIRWSEFDGRWHMASWRAYADSKLALVMFTRELSRRLAGTGVTANELHPGVIGSNFAQEKGNLAGFAFLLMRPFLATPVQGAQTSIYLAASPAVEEVSGGYFENQRLKKAARRAYDEADSERLWHLSARITGLNRAAEATAQARP